MVSNKLVYACFCTDVIHEGHLNLINEAKKYGKVVVGVLCDSEMVKYNRFPLKSTSERVQLVKNIPDVYVHHLSTVSPKNIYYDKDSYGAYNILIFDDVILLKWSIL